MRYRKKSTGKCGKLPKFFQPLLWSYVFSGIDCEVYKKRIIIQAINYGDLKHWRWIEHHYGTKSIKNVLETVSETEFRPSVLKLAGLIFKAKKFNHAPRGAR